MNVREGRSTERTVAAANLFDHVNLLSPDDRQTLGNLLAEDDDLVERFYRMQSNRATYRSGYSPEPNDSEAQTEILEPDAAEEDARAAQASMNAIRARTALDQFLMPGEFLHPNREQAARELVTYRQSLLPEDRERLQHHLGRDSGLRAIYGRHQEAADREAAGLAEEDAQHLRERITRRAAEAARRAAAEARRTDAAAMRRQADANLALYHTNLNSYMARIGQAGGQPPPAVANRRSQYTRRTDIYDEPAAPEPTALPPTLAREEAFRFPSERLPRPPEDAQPSRRFDDRGRNSRDPGRDL